MSRGAVSPDEATDRPPLRVPSLHHTDDGRSSHRVAPAPTCAPVASNNDRRHLSVVPNGPVVREPETTNEAPFAGRGSGRSQPTLARAMQLEQAGGGEQQCVAGAATPVRVLVVDDIWWWQEALLRVLEHDPAFLPVGCDTRDAALRQLGQADVVVADLDTADGNSVLAAARERGLPAVAIGDSVTQEQVSAALGLGASYAAKSELDPERVRHLVAMAAHGDALLIRASSRFLRNLTVAAPRDRYNLTPREAQVLEHLALGHTNAEIAAALHLAPSSVKKLVSRCLTRLRVRNRVEAAIVARREGLVGRPDSSVAGYASER